MNYNDVHRNLHYSQTLNLIKLIKLINLIKLMMVNQTLAVTVERYIAVCRPHQHLGLVTVLNLSYFVIITVR